MVHNPRLIKPIRLYITAEAIKNDIDKTCYTARKFLCKIICETEQFIKGLANICNYC